MDIFPHFLHVSSLRFGGWFAGGSDTHLDIKLTLSAQVMLIKPVRGFGRGC